MLLFHEVHRVRGASEDAFEAHVRDRWLPELASGDDARLLYYLHLAHGSGRAYTVVTVTAVRDGAAWERLARRVQDGDLRAWARDADQLRHDVHAKVVLPVPWAPLPVADLASVPTDPVDHDLTLFMEDTAWPHEGKLDDYLVAAHDQYAPSLTEGRHGGRSMLELLSVWQTAYGSGKRGEVILWQRVTEPKRLLGLLYTEIPEEHRAPGTWMHDALAVRDDWESRLLRTTSWSPLS
ncbi:MAG TPA: hypothetical protein VFW06_07035 [Acidimicrobiia bacterium]|nr:hypothetical protein [Acidimicrobiia bacterium]